MIERRLTMLPAPLLTLPSADRIARKLVMNAFGRLRHGHVTVALPGGEVQVLGDPRSSERVQVTIVDDAFFTRVLTQGEIGAGESYMEGEWRADDLALTVRLFVRNLEALKLDGPLQRLGQLAALVGHKLRRNSKTGSRKNISSHYDLGNDFYKLFLDDSLAYSCAIWEGGASTLEAAQRAKFDRICDKLALAAGDRLLEIGSGWGGFAIHAARTRGCHVTTVTISREQFAEARRRVSEARLDDRVDVQFCDYRELTGTYDKIVSIEMFEAVGPEYYGAFFAKCAALLEPRGLMLLQTISMPEQRFDAYRRNVDWTQKYIFPGALIPSLASIVSAMGRASSLTIDAVDNIGPHYAPTLREWRRRFFANLEAVRAQGFDERFVRMWELYLCFSEAAFAERTLGDLQILFRKQ
jgi:cyclopropane-fatty-acyl-phospholipid synthase